MNDYTEKQLKLLHRGFIWLLRLDVEQRFLTQKSHDELGSSSESHATAELWLRNRADAGFDILSRVGREIADPLAIETKTSEVPWQDAFLYLTRHELTTLQAVLHSCLHLWSVHDEVPLIAVVPVGELRAHTPQDRGGGMWREVRIAFRALEQSPVEFRPLGIGIYHRIRQTSPGGANIVS